MQIEIKKADAIRKRRHKGPYSSTEVQPECDQYSEQVSSIILLTHRHDQRRAK